MSRTITAMFDSRSDAEAARQRLVQSNIDADNVQIVDQSSSGTSGSSGGSSEGHMQGTTHGQGFWASIKEAFMTDEDRQGYEEGIRRGGYLLCARVHESRADEAIRLLDESNSIDFDERQQQWRSEGWSGFSGQGTSQGMQSSERSDTVAEERIPLVEEQLRVGKREVARGGARVRSYVEEIPVHEQVNLREEHVSVERRPVNESVSARDLDSGDLLRERNIEMTETAEEAVVGKEARVREELVVRKTAEEHVENIDDTVRRTEVDIDQPITGAENRSAFGSFGGEPRRDETDRERSDFERSEFERTGRNS